MSILIAAIRAWFTPRPKTWIYDSHAGRVRHVLATKTTTVCGIEAVSPCTAEYASIDLWDCPRCPMDLVRAGAR